MANGLFSGLTVPLSSRVAGAVQAAGGSPGVFWQALTQSGKQNAVTTKQNEGQTAALPGSGGVMPGTPTSFPTFGPPTFLPPGFTGGGFPFFPTGQPVPFGSPLQTGQIGPAITGSGICDQLPSPLKEICKGAGVVFTKPGGENGGKPGKGQAPPECPPGNVRIGNTCVAPGDMFPGGAPGLSEAGGQAVRGAFGLPAISPTIVGSVANNRGEVSPIRRCPRGMALGFDNLCYPKAVLPRRSRFRKHKAPRKPPMTGADAAALRRIGTLQKKARELAGDAGLTCKKK